MSSDIVSFLQAVVLNNYLTLAAITAVVYDYALTFSKEVQYVWCRPWTWVSTMCVVARYLGLYWIVTAALTGTSFVPGPAEVSKVMYLSYYWSFIVFLSTADLLMILRVYAMWNRSRTILYVLLLVFIIQTLITVVSAGIYTNPNTHLSVTTFQILDLSVCGAGDDANYAVYFIPLRLVLSALLAILAFFQTLRQSLEMYKATKQWQPNCYMQQLVKDGILYFIVNMLYQIIDLLNITGFQTAPYIFLYAFVSVAFYTLIPRFVISIRELYDLDIRRGRFHVDTGFGVVTSQLNAGQDTTVSAMVFVDGNQGAEVEGSTDNLGDLGMDSVHGSRSHKGSPLEPGSSRV